MSPTQHASGIAQNLAGTVVDQVTPAMSDTPDSSSGVGMSIRPRRLMQIILVIICTVMVVAAQAAWDHDWISLGLLLGVQGLLCGVLWAARLHRVALAAKLAVIVLTALMCGLSWFGSGLYDVAICAFPAILVFAAMFVGRRFFSCLLLIIVAFLGCLALAHQSGWHVSQPQPVTTGTSIDLAAIMVATAYFVWRLATDLRLALQRLATENRRIHQALSHIDALATSDALTGLPNRPLARARFDQLVELSKRNDDRIALLFLDIDNFKTVNDSLGHAAGDQLICDVAQRLKTSVRASDTVSRQGGDEFLVILSGQSDQQSVATVAAKIIEVMALPFQVNNVEVFATCSLGVAMYPDNGHDFDALLKHADMAMYRAKESGRNAFRFYDAQMNTNVLEHLHLIAGIRGALLKNEFTLHYQPQFDLQSGRIVGAEALIRWHSAELGNVPPNRFIPVAERSGQIHDIGTWVIGEACRQAADWRSAGLDDLVVGINLSPIQFRREHVESDVMNALRASNLPPSAIELELTESLLIVDSESLRSLLKRIRALGVHLSIDDFGTGYSNLGYLTRFEVERLKIDQSFIRHMTENSTDEGIVRAIIEMAHILKLQVVAEGVENEAVLNRLKQMGCEFGQGYHWSPAMPPAEFYRYVIAHRGKGAPAT